ncbi:hypothetical protein N7539_003042 [Penicillium diatomitis]|uniref:Thioesterase-like superfamily-domain-containing protein n=1 Tax=Penicillium diatomitis TaxID=2819901 RepID=A0A9W9XFT8_9EURO|nr:uncharacterized protein N7539_003042 [Penicillium diatomitis]KAJ5491475.1 hypothetical protein N7539_003042 [Penicillium diatomitis]
MSSPNASFVDAIRVTPHGGNKYSANLHRDWCIGTVPHGGYTAAVLYNLAVTHFAHAHPKQFDTPATPISLQLSFLRRTAAGPATLHVEDVKLGLRTSTIHVKLLQPSEKNPATLQVNVAGYITVSPATAEVGISAPTGWKPYPVPPAGSRANGQVDLFALACTGQDGSWTKLDPPYAEFRRAAAQLELYGPGKGQTQQQRTGTMAIDQWARFRPGGDQNGRWTDAAVVYLLDMFPMALDGFDTMSATAVAREKGEPGPTGSMANFWYPTVTLNVDMKKRLPRDGVEWLYSRIVTKVVRDGRTDLDVTVLDENGEVVALSTQVGLVVSASRNVGSRKWQKL